MLRYHVWRPSVVPSCVVFTDVVSAVLLSAVYWSVPVLCSSLSSFILLIIYLYYILFYLNIK